MNRALAALLLAGAVGSANAAAIYRCSVGDRIVYSQMPCTDGTLIDAADPRTAAQRAEAVRVAASERKAAAELERERKKAGAGKPAQAVGIDARPPVVEVAASAAPARDKPKKRFKVDPAKAPAKAASAPA